MEGWGGFLVGRVPVGRLGRARSGQGSLGRPGRARGGQGAVGTCAPRAVAALLRAVQVPAGSMVPSWGTYRVP